METITIVLLILSVFIAAGFAYFHYLYKANNKLNLLLAFLRFLSLFGIFILLINPTVTSTLFEVDKTPLVVVMDNSSSISFSNSQNEAFKSYRRLVGNSNLQEKFDIQTCQFDADFTFSSVFTFNGKQTNLGAVAKGITTTFKSKNYPIILLTDGNQTTGDDYEYSFNFANKVFPIVLGDTTKVFDLKINQINVNKYAFYKKKLPVEVFVHYSGYKNVKANFRIQHGKAVMVNQYITFSSSKKTAVLNVVLPATQKGLQLYQATITSTEKEKNHFNNSKKFAVNVIDQKSDIAFVSAINHPDIGALKRAIESNVQRKVTLVKPQDSNELSKHKIAVFYQPNSSFKAAFDQSKLAGINVFVITGSATDFVFLNQQQNDLEFKMGSQTEDYFADFNSQFNLFAIDTIGFDSFPPLQNNFGTINSKGNVLVLLSSKIRGMTIQSPLLAFVENNTKRTAYLLGENSWKWRAQSFINNQSFEKYDVFIDKIVQFLATKGEKKSLVVEHELLYNLGDEIAITAQYFNKNFEFDEQAKLSIAVQNQMNKSFTNYDLVKGSNSFKVNLDQLPPGKYNFTITELNSKERFSGHFEILDFDIEKQFANSNFDKLNQLANHTQGKVYFPNQIDNLVQNLLKNEDYKAIQKEVVTKSPLIEWIWTLVIIALLLATEWLVRKYNGLL